MATVVLGLLLAARPVSAQGIGYGVKGGVAFASLHFSGQDDVPTKTRLGAIGGGFVAIPLTGRLAVQPEVLFVQKGVKVEDFGTDVTTELDYVEVPALVTFAVGPRGLRVYGGPSVGFKVRARVKADLAGESIDEDIGDSVKTTAFELVAGAEYQVGRVLVDGRYMWGLASLDKDTSSVKSRAFAVMAGFRF